MHWVARYKDQTELPQYNADGSENRYVDIDRSKLDSFTIYHTLEVDTGNVECDDHITFRILEVHLEPGQRLICRRRNELKPGEDVPTTVWMVGWQQTVNGVNVQSIAYINPDGSIDLSGRWNEKTPWFYAPELLPCEFE